MLPSQPSELECIFGPTFEEMRSPERLPEPVREAARIARTDRPLDPINLFNIHWKDDLGEVMAVLVPTELTGVSTPIAVLTGLKYPTGSLKVGPAYAMMIERQVHDQVLPGQHSLVFPSAGNFGLAGAWAGTRMGYRSQVALPDDGSRERWARLGELGAEVISSAALTDLATQQPEAVLLDPLGDFAGYRFHTAVTAKAVEELAESLAKQGIGRGRVSVFASMVGSGGTMGAGDPLKEHHGTLLVALEPINCSTLINAGFGPHRIEGAAERQVTWIHNVLNTDAVIGVDDLDAIRGLALIQDGGEVLSRELGIGEDQWARLSGTFGISGVANVIGAIKAVKHFRLGPRDLVVTVAPDGADRYGLTLEWLARREGRQDRDRALRRIELFHRASTDCVLEATRETRRRWHNQKYFTWVEQQGKSVEALEMQRDPDFWREQRARAAEIDRRILERRPTLGG